MTTPATAPLRTVRLWPGPLREIVLLDTETTGFGPGARLVEIAAIRARDGRVLETLTTLVNPQRPIPPDATDVHGITDAMVRRAPTARSVLRELLAFVRDTPLAAHYAPFDRGILAGELARAALPFPGLPLYCTCRIAKRAIVGAPDYKLATLARHLRLRSAPSHRALADAQTALALLDECVQRTGRSIPALQATPGTL